MIIRKENYIFDIDIESARAYSASHSLCSCGECRNFYRQVRGKLPKLAAFLDEMGIRVECPDEIGSSAADGRICYDFAAYTVPGRIIEIGRYEIDLQDGGLHLNIVVNSEYVPNEQKTSEYFTISVYNISLPWILDEPFPEPIELPRSLSTRIKGLFKMH